MGLSSFYGKGVLFMGSSFYGVLFMGLSSFYGIEFFLWD